MNSTAVVLLASILAYGVVGGLVLQVWYRRVERQRPANVPALSNAWLRPLLPRLFIAVEVFALGAGFLVVVELLLTTPRLLHSKAAPAFILGLAGGLVLMSVVFAVIDVFAIRQSRRAAGAHQNDPT